MGGWPKDPDARKAIRALKSDFDWTYDTSVGKSAHRAGRLLCGAGCDVTVYSTARNTARALWRAARRCTHGHAPDRTTP